MMGKESFQQLDLLEVERVLLFSSIHVLPFLLAFAGGSKIQCLSQIHFYNLLFLECQPSGCVTAEREAVANVVLGKGLADPIPAAQISAEGRVGRNRFHPD